MGLHRGTASYSFCSFRSFSPGWFTRATARLVLTGVLLTGAGYAGSARADELDTLAAAIDANPDDARAYDAYALAAFRTKRFDDAIRKLKVGVARIADYSEGYYKLAYAFRQKKEWADAADYYRRYIALNPTKTDPYFGLGAALQGLGDKKGAIAAYDKYVSLEQSPAKQRFVDQVKAELVKLDPSRAPAPPPQVAPPVQAAPAGDQLGEAASLRAEADRLKREGRLEEAADTYRRAIALDRSQVSLHNELGSVLFGLKRYSEAANAFREATSRDPAFALGWYNLAHAMRKADRKGEAIDAYRTYIRLKPEDPDPYYGLGQTLKALGDAPGAIDAFRKYVAMEKRPEEQKWVEKARAELEALEGTSRPPGAGRATEDKARIDGAEQDGILIPPGLSPTSFVTPWSPEGLLDPFPEFGRGGRMGDLKAPFGEGAADDPDGLMDPFRRAQREVPADVALNAVPGARRRLVAYGQAVAAYRRAIARHLESVVANYERGVSYALADDGVSAARIWNGVMARDPEVEQARRDLERIRGIVVAGSRRR